MLKIFVLTLLIALTFAAEDYCDQTLCSKGKTHVGCKQSGQFASTCPKGSKIVKFDAEHIKCILNEINKARNEAALGMIPKLPKASRLGTVQWDPVLAQLAEYNCKSCIFDHDKCRNTKTYPKVGQNIFQCANSEEIPLKTLIGKAFKMWDSEKLKATEDQVKNGPNWREIGHWSQLVHESVNRIGFYCISWTESSFKKYYCVCNFNAGNDAGKPIYKIASKDSGCDCKTGKHKLYKGLCSPNEKPLFEDDNSSSR